MGDAAGSTFDFTIKLADGTEAAYDEVNINGASGLSFMLEGDVAYVVMVDADGNETSTKDAVLAKKAAEEEAARKAAEEEAARKAAEEEAARKAAEEEAARKAAEEEAARRAEEEAAAAAAAEAQSYSYSEPSYYEPSYSEPSYSEPAYSAPTQSEDMCGGDGVVFR